MVDRRRRGSRAQGAASKEDSASCEILPSSFPWTLPLTGYGTQAAHQNLEQGANSQEEPGRWDGSSHLHFQESSWGPSSLCPFASPHGPLSAPFSALPHPRFPPKSLLPPPPLLLFQASGPNLHQALAVSQGLCLSGD